MYNGMSRLRCSSWSVTYLPAWAGMLQLYGPCFYIYAFFEYITLLDMPQNTELLFIRKLDRKEQRHALWDRRPGTTACPACWAMGTNGLNSKGHFDVYWGRLMNEIQTKVLRVFLLAIPGHLYAFALRFLFLQNHATSYSFFSLLLCTL